MSSSRNAPTQPDHHHFSGLLPPPRLKRKASATQTVPPSSSSPSECSSSAIAVGPARPRCSGVLHGTSAVIVTSQLDILTLVRRGCFGKGIFSRSIPTHGHLPPPPGEGSGRCRQKYDDGRMEQFERTQMKRLDLHREWKRELEGREEEEEKEGEVEEGKKEKESRPADTTCDLQEQSDTRPNSESSRIHLDSSSESPGSPGKHSTLTEERYSQLVQRVKALAESDPYKISEYLQLNSEEAFYLVQELGELIVFTTPTGDTDPHVCRPVELWSMFCETNSRFLERYIAYRYYRQRGWVPKSGLKFGVDFLLYKDGPAVYHSSYAVIVKSLEQLDSPVVHPKQTTSAGMEGDVPVPLTWQEVISHCRVNESVAKDLLVCYVTRGASLGTSASDVDGGSHEGDWRRSPGCVTDFTVCEILVRRWIPDRERNAP